ncbi:hypothetical protein OHV05_15300 [Kitasatospora sp. NBC_00070]|uniref:zinc finger domain-containing protein n=1 Tax=Kitasatospora sp. NBC_00070 TaxID=2975962 RepID=UPI00324F6AD5
MTPDECAALLAYVGRLDPRAAHRDPAETAGQLATWCDLLRDVPATAPDGWDAAAVARAHITGSPYPILPVDITRPWTAHRRALLARHTDPRPNVDPDDVEGYQQAIRAQRDAVATGAVEPTASRELAGGPHPQLAHLIARALPAAAAAALAPFRPLRAAREAAALAGRPDALNVPCTWCRAPVGEPCRRRTSPKRAEQQGGWSRRSTVHPSRLDAATEQANRQERAA